jgi:UDP-sulfoquinovose synthase
LWFEARSSGIRVTDLMQGPVYGHATDEARDDPMLMPHFHYDDIFGTVVNRFVAQAATGVPLTVYGRGSQLRGYIDLRDAMRCVELVALKPPRAGEMRVFNQFTEIFSVIELAERVARVGRSLGLGVEIGRIANPRREREEHYYRPAHDGLLKLGLEPRRLGDDRIAEMIEFVRRRRDAIDRRKILPRVAWAGEETAP